MRVLILLALVGSLVACGSRTEAPLSSTGVSRSGVRVESCNGRDDDGRNGVDDPFRDSQGRYVDDQHCGACNQGCALRPNAELEVHCTVANGLPRCTASRCAAGYSLSRDGRCAKNDERLCLACASDEDCGALNAARCVYIAGENRCSIDCAVGCPAGYQCDNARRFCVPSGGSCSCEASDSFDFACSVDDPTRDAGAPVCVGQARCDKGRATSCTVSVEICDELDNDCDGEVDEDFRDELGAYSKSAAHCGQCGSECIEETGLEQKLTCGGDPYAPRCTLACPDALNGVQVGDHLDADFDLTTGCECVVQRLVDGAGPVGAEGQLLDEDCDGADGIVRASFYVAGDGNDDGPGSPTRPLRTISAAIKRAKESLTSKVVRPSVYVASGSYTETITLADGVSVYGGYRRDFRALDPKLYAVEVRAARPATAPGGAALMAVDVGRTTTRLLWMSLRGLDTSGEGGPALGAYIERPGSLLLLTGLTIRAGVPGEGEVAANGAAGAAPNASAVAGSPPRVALEDASHTCLRDGSNRVAGGAGGQALCGTFAVSGGAGGSAACPDAITNQASGLPGSGAGAGAGGRGGQDSQGPTQTNQCGGTVCCGLADFTVPTDFQGPLPGNNGGDGANGAGGAGCRDSLGRFVGANWSSMLGSAGTAGQPGAGGGGGGAGGGAQMRFVQRECEWPDGLGGGGGGGGAGGCGGQGGQPGKSGAPSVAMLVVTPGVFVATDVLFATANGGRGGAGGAGGDGGEGGSGAAGGSLPTNLRVTPPLAGPFPGGRGGTGGAGGAGGGGGGGCGGSALGVWLVGGSSGGVGVWRSANNRFQLGAGGAGGLGGVGASPGSAGLSGGAIDVLAQ